MATSQNAKIFRNLTYSDKIKDQIVRSGGTVVFSKDNIVVASEVSEAMYRELLKSTYIEKMDILPLKRYKNQGIKYTKNEINQNLTGGKTTFTPNTNTTTSTNTDTQNIGGGSSIVSGGG
jgi:hypothetical protein